VKEISKSVRKFTIDELEEMERDYKARAKLMEGEL